MMRRFLLPLAFLLVALAAVAAAAGAHGATRPTLTVQPSDYGQVLWDGSNRALYAFTADRGGKSRCSGACAKAWPPYYETGTLRAGAGVKRSLLGTIRRSDGRRQVTYAGRPLYYYAADPKGRILCQNVREFGGLWLVVRASGALVR
jgi:predicted lipoprotein with Yx(FWY)xxD motif